MASSRNVQWSEECATKWVYLRAQAQVNISSFRSGYFDDRTKKTNEKCFLRKIEKCVFGRNPKASYFMTETLIVQKIAYILASLCEGECFSYLFSVLRKISYKLEKKKKKSEKFTLFAQKIGSKKNFDVTFSLKCSLQKAYLVQLTKPWIPYLVSAMRYRSSSLKWPRKRFWNNHFSQKNEGIILDDVNFVGQKNSLRPCCFSRKRIVSVSFISFEKYEVRVSCPKKEVWKKLTLF